MAGGMIAAGSHALAQSDDEAVRVAISLCFEPPASTGGARQALEEAGWAEDNEAAVQALSASVLGRSFDAQDTSRSITNAAFVAASVLSNSSLGDDQVSMRSGDVRLAFLGIMEGTPYCVFSGPQNVAQLFMSELPLDGGLTQRSDTLTQLGSVSADNHLISLTIFDDAALGSVLTEFNEQQAQGETTQADLRDFFLPVAASITSPQAREAQQ